jgi:4-carboxymuconolactone decarboxylase
MKESFDRGMKTRREVLGDEHVDRATAAITPFTEDFQSYITRNAWGDVWTRPGLDRKTRSCMAITALIAHNHMEELGMHIRAGFRNGLTAEEISEVILQSGVYCGIPSANAAYLVAQKVVEEVEGEGEG